MTDRDLSIVWQDVLVLLENKAFLDKVVIDTYFQDAKLVECNKMVAMVVVDSSFSKMVLTSEKKHIETCLAEVTNYNDISVNILLKNEMFSQNDNNTDDEWDDNLNPNYTFETFVEGPSNRESYRAALACASHPEGFTYCPLFIYGDSGLGKTHLMNAIGNFIKTHNPKMKVLFLTTDDFINSVVDASKNKKLKELKEKMMSLDVLLLDDVQYLAGGKETSSETLFNIYNQLKKKNKIIVITSDKKPWEIKELEERLVSRLSNGLTCCIESPEFETALKILKMKLKDRTEDISIDEDVLKLLASNFDHDVRALEGLLNRLIFYSLQFSNNSNIDIDLAKQALKGEINSTKKKELTIPRIQKTVAEYYSITKSQLISKNKAKAINDARAIAIYLCRNRLDVSFDTIGKEFGGRDHSTIMNANKKIEERLKIDVTLGYAINEIDKLLIE